MKRNYSEFLGSNFGRLTVLSLYREKYTNKVRFYCFCECGNIHTFSMGNQDRTNSCGCLNKDLLSKRKTTHGHSGKVGTRSKAYSVWTNMKSRCTNEKSTHYEYYGGKGITYCKEWDIFENFLKDMGEPKDNLTLDRINTNGNYEPSNCRWVSMMDQAKNKSNNMWLNINGESIHLMEASRRYPIKMQTIWARVRMYGWTHMQALGLEPKPDRNRKTMEYSKRQELKTLGG